MPHFLRLGGALVLATALGACDSSPGPDAQGGLVRLSIATRAAPGAAGTSVVGAPVVFADSTDTLVITQVQMVVREVELEGSVIPADSTACKSGGDDDSDGHGDIQAGDDFDDDDSGECEEQEIEFGPSLLDLPLSTGATTVLTVEVQAGTYEEFEFKVGVPEDSAFLALHPDFAGVSIRVTGTWNGTAFTYETAVRAKQELDIEPPLVVSEFGSTDITLFIDIGTWFRAADGKLLDPATANAGGPNEALVNANIVKSFGAFEDEDHDGCDDHGDDGEHGGDGDHSGED